MAERAQIRQLMDRWAEAVRAKDVDRVMSHYATDIVTFDLAPPLQYRGADECRKNWEAWFPTFRGPIGYQVHDLNIAASEDVAFCHSFNRITGTRTDDEKTDVWVRATVCCRKTDGKWKIAHEHQSGAVLHGRQLSSGGRFDAVGWAVIGVRLPGVSSGRNQ